MLCCLTLSTNLHAQGDVAQQIKQLQQDSRNAQMKNDASWAQQHLADGFVAGNSWGDWETKDDFIKICRTRRTSGRAAPLVTCKLRPSARTPRFHITHSRTMLSLGAR